MEDSISINISLVASSWADLISDGIYQLLLSKEQFREGIRFQDKDDAKQHLVHLLKSLKHTVSELSVEDLLPDSMFTPRPSTIDIDSALLSSNTIAVSPLSSLRRNPIAVLLPLTTLSQPEIGQSSSNSSDSEETETTTSQNKFALHINFGNEELASIVRIELRCSTKLAPLVQYLCELNTSQTLVVDSLATFSQSQGMHIEALELQKLLGLFRQSGYLTLLSGAQNNKTQVPKTSNL